MEEGKVTTVEDIVEKAAKRLDKVLCKYGKSNGIVNVRNFNVVGRKKVYLQGSELSKVGTGYSSNEKTLEGQIDSIIDQIEADCKATGTVEKVAVKASDLKPEASKTPVVEEDKKPAGEEDENKGGEGDEDEDKTPEPEFTKKQLEDICKKRGIKVPRGADKKALAALIEADQAAK